MAMLDPPNIARVLDAGTTDDGRPYFVMELVKGVRITKFWTSSSCLLASDSNLPCRSARLLACPPEGRHPPRLQAVEPGRPLRRQAGTQGHRFGVAKATGPRLTDQTM